MSTSNQSAMYRTRHRLGLTLSELLVVVAIVATLMGIILPAIQRARHTADRFRCSSHLRQVGIALHQYHSDRRVFPVGVSFQNGVDSNPHMTWMARLLPYVEEDALWQETLRAYRTDK